MTSRRLSYIGFASVLALGANGCASVPPPARMVEVRPARTPAEPPGSAAGNLYQAAVAAVDRRDYARALELLQAARDRAPQDARVLNAFGVVYDKLGRFDLSSRYYAQAQVADPGSSIVAGNQAYSSVLQGKAPLPVLAAQEAAPSPAPPAAPTLTPTRTASLATETPPAPAPTAAAGLPPTHIALAQAPKLAAPPPAAVPAPLVVASAQAAPERRLTAPLAAPLPVTPPQAQTPQAAPAVEHAAAAAPVTRMALAASREPLPAAPAPLQRSPLTVGLVVAPSSPAPRLAVTPLQVASIPLQTSLKIQPPSLQARVQLAALPVAPMPTPPVPALSQPVAATKPLIVLQSQAEKRSPLPAITQVAVRTNAPAMVVAPSPARAPARLTALPLLQSTPAAVLRRVNLPVFQVASSLTPQAYGLTSRPPEERAAPAPRRAVASAPVRTAGLTRAVARIAAPPAVQRPAGSSFIGRALVIIDASGNRRVADALRLQLARRGWSVPAARLPSVAKRSQTTIRYAAAHVTVARALANSLRTPVKLERCARPCRGVSLILGADSRAPAGNLRTTSGLRRLS